MNRHPFQRCVALTLLASTAGAALAAGYTIERSVIAGGGSTASGGGYRVHSTLAQPVAGPSATGTQAAWHGFWYPQAGAQEPVGDHIFRNGFER